VLWNPDVDLNGLGPLVRNLSNPSRRTRQRHHVLLDLLLECPSDQSIVTVRKILAAYPYLRGDYESKIVCALEQLHISSMDHDDDDEVKAH
jgi:hypothetical protein